MGDLNSTLPLLSIAFTSVCVFTRFLFYGPMYNFETARKTVKVSLTQMLSYCLNFKETLKRENFQEKYPYCAYQNTFETLLLLTKTFIYYRAHARIARISNYLKLGLITSSFRFEKEL